jgi:hypothetical protein
MTMSMLSLIPFCDWCWAILAALLLAFGIHYRNLERDIHQVKQVAVAAQTQVKAVDKAAETTETQSAIIYKQAVIIPVVGDIGVECVRKQPRSSPLPAPDTKPGTSAGVPTPDSSVGPGYDPSGAALARAKAADAQIAYLQRRVKELETQMNNSP